MSKNREFVISPHPSHGIIIQDQSVAADANDFWQVRKVAFVVRVFFNWENKKFPS
jgi:hypothetical protein